jgi:hypothetical protein
MITMPHGCPWTSPQLTDQADFWHPQAPAPSTTTSVPAESNTTTPCGGLANRLVGILHGCLKTRTLCDEATAWSHREEKKPAA